MSFLIYRVIHRHRALFFNAVCDFHPQICDWLSINVHCSVNARISMKMGALGDATPGDSHPPVTLTAPQDIAFVCRSA